ncbi:hypothetical protein BJ741DRAFT_661826 [Chytriomyces cf. hyalinus JEL632]|nr:hypothetical protein BJ741DRAFT_661826 [Chytriomyces cf. hyalinus JEL632]
MLVKDGRAKGSWQNSACLREAYIFGHLGVVKLLLARTDADINAHELATEAEIQQLVLTHLPIDKNLAEAVWIPEDMVIVMRHMQAAADRKEVEFLD